MKRLTFHLLFALFTFCIGIVAPAGYSFFRCDSGPVTKNWRTYTNEEYATGYVTLRVGSPELGARKSTCAVRESSSLAAVPRTRCTPVSASILGSRGVNAR